MVPSRPRARRRSTSRPYAERASWSTAWRKRWTTFPKVRRLGGGSVLGYSHMNQDHRAANVQRTTANRGNSRAVSVTHGQPAPGPESGNDQAVCLVIGCGQGRDRTADLPLFRQGMHPRHGIGPRWATILTRRGVHSWGGGGGGDSRGLPGSCSGTLEPGEGIGRSPPSTHAHATRSGQLLSPRPTAI